jgi:hypothetical protein
MTTTAELIHPSGPFPAIRSIECAPWCADGDGHVNATSRDDQICWGSGHYVELSLEEVTVEYDKRTDTRRFWPSIIGPNAYRGYNERPCVYLHYMLQDHHRGELLDDSCKLTTAEARRLAVALLNVAYEIEQAGDQ